MIAGADGTDGLLRALAVQYNAASRSGRDDDLWAVQQAAAEARRAGVAHGDLALLLVQVHLDSHAVSAAAAVLAEAPAAAATPTGQMLGAGVALQRGDPGGAGVVLARLVADDPTSWRALALLAAVYEELADAAAADLLYAEGMQQLDARQLAGLAWLECQRARLRLESGRLDGADQHLRRAEQAAGGWSVAAVRGRWQEAAGHWEQAAQTRTQVAETTGRPDHAQAAAGCWARLGRPAELRRWDRQAAAGFETARQRWPYRYAHHEVTWHLAAGRDQQAVEVAECDFRERPAAKQAVRLAVALEAVGESQRAQDLLDEQERRRRPARAALADQVLLLNQAVCAV